VHAVHGSPFDAIDTVSGIGPHRDVDRFIIVVAVVVAVVVVVVVVAVVAVVVVAVVAVRFVAYFVDPPRDRDFSTWKIIDKTSAASTAPAAATAAAAADAAVDRSAVASTDPSLP